MGTLPGGCRASTRPTRRRPPCPCSPDSLNVALGAPFDWFAPPIEERIVWFGREEYGGERDILLLPCVLTNLKVKTARLCVPTPTTRTPTTPPTAASCV